MKNHRCSKAAAEKVRAALAKTELLLTVRTGVKAGLTVTSSRSLRLETRPPVQAMYGAGMMPD